MRMGSDFEDRGVGGDFEFGELHEDLRSRNRALLLPERSRSNHLDFDLRSVFPRHRERDQRPIRLHRFRQRVVVFPRLLLFRPTRRE